jgi:two-component system, OmpR family, KDP operon response regulator KdpE
MQLLSEDEMVFARAAKRAVSLPALGGKLVSQPCSVLPCTVLIVEGEASLRTELRTSLSAGEFTVEEARSGEEAVKMAQHESFDLVLLDINVPGIGGVEACRRLRDLSPRTGIVVMVTVDDLEDDRVPALEAGADDYVTMPFWPRELIARLRVVLRRARARETQEPPVLQAGPLRMDLHRRILWHSGTQLHLSPKEFDLLAFLMQNQGAPLTHEQLLHSVWGPDCGKELEYLRTYICALRKKIENDPANPDYILTEPWVGYRFRTH